MALTILESRVEPPNRMVGKIGIRLEPKFEPQEVGRCYTNDFELQIAQSDLASDGACVSTKELPPERVAQNNPLGGAMSVVFGSE